MAIETIASNRLDMWRCDWCERHTAVAHGMPDAAPFAHVDGWILLSAVELVNRPKLPKLAGLFCSPECTMRWLARNLELGGLLK